MLTIKQPATVESYWRLAWQWFQQQRGNHGRWCGCLACADLRQFRGQPPCKTDLERIAEERGT